MSNSMFADQATRETTIFRPMLVRTAGVDKVFEVCIRIRTPIRTAPMVQSESLLDEVGDFVLMDL
jgi:hypothetical protein